MAKHQYKLPLSKEICDRIGQDIHTALVDIGVKYVMDVQQFKKAQGLDPDSQVYFGSIFSIDAGGSFDYETKYGRVHVYNGCLLTWEQKISIASIEKLYIALLANL